MKDTFYFSHDYNARNDIKIKRLIAKHNYLGYGLFWAIIEDLYNNANALPLDYDCIAFDLRADVETVKSIINDFDLFTQEDGFFGSLSIQKRLDERNTKSQKARESALNRWNKSERNANALQTQSDSNAIKERKVKEIKGNERKDFLLEKETKGEILNSQKSADKIPVPEERKKVAPKKEINLPFPTPEFKAIWDLWKAYRKKKDKFQYFDEESEQKALTELFNLSKQNQITAIAIIRQSIDKGWKGFFEIKHSTNGHTKSTSGNLAQARRR